MTDQTCDYCGKNPKTHALVRGGPLVVCFPCHKIRLSLALTGDGVLEAYDAKMRDRPREARS